MALTKAKLEELIAGGDISIGAGPHSHGNITEDGKIGTTADLTLMTGAGGLVVARTMAEAISIWKFTNPNLLHNPDFRNPVNQRGVSGAISTGAEFYDRWIRNSGTVTTNAAYLTIGAGAVIEQRIEFNLLAGKTVTVSVMAGGTVYSGTGTFSTSAGTASLTLTGWGTATLGYAAGYMYVRLSPTAASNIQAVKLELGTVSTLAYDPPMDRVRALQDCLPYFIKFGDYYPKLFGFTTTTGTVIEMMLPMPCIMRAAPTVSLTPIAAVYGGQLKIGSVTSTQLKGNQVVLNVSNISGFPVRVPIIGQIQSEGVWFSSDL